MRIVYNNISGCYRICYKKQCDIDNSVSGSNTKSTSNRSNKYSYTKTSSYFPDRNRYQSIAHHVLGDHSAHN